MLATNAAFASGGMTHCFCRCGLRMFFLASARLCCRWRGRQCAAPRRPPSSSCNVHRLRPLGGSEQASAISFASAAPSKMRGLAEAGECLRTRTASKPSSTSCWRVRATVSTLVSRASAIWLSLHPSPASGDVSFQQNACLGQLPGRVFAHTYQRVETLPLLIAERHYVLLHGNPFRGHDASPSLRSYRFGKSPRNQ